MCVYDSKMHDDTLCGGFVCLLLSFDSRQGETRVRCCYLRVLSDFCTFTLPLRSLHLQRIAYHVYSIYLCPLLRSTTAPCAVVVSLARRNVPENGKTWFCRYVARLNRLARKQAVGSG